MTRDNLYHHEHGGEPERRFGLRREDVLDFSVNISPISPPLPEETIDSCELHRYPSIDGGGVAGFYRDRFGLARECVLPVSGAIEGIYLIPRALGIRRAVILTPSFFDYERACRIAGSRVTCLWLEEKKRFELPCMEILAGRIGESDAIFAANPNNPTGTRFPKEVFLELASRFPDKWFVMDEAFIQYTDDFPLSSLMQDVRAMKNVLVVHSLTKFYALPGLRLGAVIAHPDTVGTLLKHKEPWTVNAVAERVAGELFNCGEYEKEVRTLIATERAKIFRQLKSVPEITVRGYGANFFLAQWNAGSDLDELLEYLIGRGIHVRDCRNFPGLEDNYFRFSIRKPEENDYLLEQLLSFGKRVGAALE